jgi:hypothetical protein
MTIECGCGCGTSMESTGLMQDDPTLLMAAAAYLLKGTNVLGKVKA